MTELSADLYDFQYHSQLRNHSRLGGTRTWNRLTLNGALFDLDGLDLPDEELWLPTLAIEPGLLSVSGLVCALESGKLTKLGGLNQAGRVVVESVVAEKLYDNA